jgi:hypothetical protein
VAWNDALKKENAGQKRFSARNSSEKVKLPSLLIKEDLN